MASAPPPILHHCAGSGSARWLPRSLIAGLAAVWSKAPALAPFDGWGGVTIGTITFAAAASPRHSASVTISGGSMVNDTTWHTLLTTWHPHFFGHYLDSNLVTSSTAANTATSIAWSIFRFGWGFSTSQDFNGDIALIACFASSWTPTMVRRWHADPFGFLRPWNEVPALIGSAPPATPPSTGTGVVICLMG
jgi:hypothetical protein